MSECLIEMTSGFCGIANVLLYLNWKKIEKTKYYTAKEKQLEYIGGKTFREKEGYNTSAYDYMFFMKDIDIKNEMKCLKDNRLEFENLYSTYNVLFKSRKKRVLSLIISIVCFSLAFLSIVYGLIGKFVLHSFSKDDETAFFILPIFLVIFGGIILLIRQIKTIPANKKYVNAKKIVEKALNGKYENINVELFIKVFSRYKIDGYFYVLDKINKKSDDSIKNDDFAYEAYKQFKTGVILQNEEKIDVFSMKSVDTKKEEKIIPKSCRFIELDYRDFEKINKVM